MADFDVLVLGEINADLILGDGATPVFGQAEKLVDDATLTMGSSGVIFACGCARLGLHVVYCGVVGDDMFGRYMIDNMKARGVDTEGVIVSRELKTGLSVILNEGNDRAILTHLGAINSLTADQVDRSLLAGTRHLHVSSYFLQRALQPDLPALLAEAKAAAASISMDTNWDPDEMWNHGLAHALTQTDILLPNANEALAISGKDTLESAEDRLAEIVDSIAVKLGAEGAHCRQGDAFVSDPGFPVDVIDTTGAGDSFDAGFVCGQLRRMSLSDSLALACACGALSTRAAGGTDAQPTFEEAQSLIERRAAQATDTEARQ